MRDDLSRREFLTDSFILFSLLALPKNVFSAIDPNIVGYRTNLFFDTSDLSKIKENINLSLFKNYYASLVNIDFEKEKKFITEVDLNNHVGHLAELSKKIIRSSFVGLVEDNKEHVEIAKLSVKKTLEFNEWDYFYEDITNKPIGLQRGPETTIAMCLAYDWLKEKLSDKEKDDIINGIVEKGVPTCYNSLYYMRHPEKSKRWYVLPHSKIKFEANTTRWPYFLNRTNLKFIPVAGLTIASVLLHGKNPHARKWLELSRWGVETTAKVFYKDGSYDENVGYWDYSIRHIIMAIELLKRNLNIDYSSALNFRGSIKFGLAMMSPFKNYKGAVINFGDCGFNYSFSTGFWVAKEFKDELSQHAAEVSDGNREIFSLVYYNKDIKAKLPEKKDLDIKFDLGWIVSRTGWSENDSVLAFRSGEPANHEHADRNSFIFQAFGDRLLHDPMGAAYLASEKHWLLRLTEAHNAVLIDGKGHFFHDGSEGTNMTTAKAKILHYKAKYGVTEIVSDATQPYQLSDKDVKKVRRSLFFFKPDIILLVDEVEKKETASTIQARFHPFNQDDKAQVLVNEPVGFEISRPYAKLYGKVFSSQGASVAASRLDIPEEEIKYSANVGLRKQKFPFVEISTVNSAKKMFLLTVLSAQKSEITAIPDIKIKNDNQKFLIEINKHDGKFIFDLRVDKKYPYINKYI